MLFSSAVDMAANVDSADAYHHRGVANQALKHRVDHREEPAHDRGGAWLARGGLSRVGGLHQHAALLAHPGDG